MIRCTSVSQTLQFAKKVAAYIEKKAGLKKLKPGMSIERPVVLVLNGSVGVGKSTFTRGVFRSLIEKHQKESLPDTFFSPPTFTLEQKYEIESIGLSMRHLDLYRYVSAEESVIQHNIELLGLKEALRSGLIVLLSS